MLTADEAIAAIAPGQRILIGSGAAEPVSLVDALVRAAPRFSGTEIVHLLTLGPAPYVAPELSAHFRHVAFFIGANVRAAVRAGRAEYMPVFLSEIPNLIRSRRVGIDVALVQVSPPDKHGFVSLGVSVDIVRAAVDTARIIIAEVNPNMPRSLGDSFLHLSRITHLVQSESPLLCLEEEQLEGADVATYEALGQHIAALIPDGACLQLGIGKIPNAVLGQLRHHVDLGIHTEMFSDGVMPLVEAGVITGRRKNRLPGKIVSSFVMGSQTLYRWLDNNPRIEMRPSEYTNDPNTIARNDQMVSINAALAVDLTGQVAADSIGPSFYSGIGGQVDFVRGARRSCGGKSIIALPSTAKNGEVSRIQSVLQEGSGVVTSRGDVQYVVTEYGSVDLVGLCISARAEALIRIAHPDHQPELRKRAAALRYIHPANRSSLADSTGPA